MYKTTLSYSTQKSDKQKDVIANAETNVSKGGKQLRVPLLTKKTRMFTMLNLRRESRGCDHFG